MKVLVIAPHADDEILGCGGVIAKHVTDGDKVFVAVMTNAAVGAPELFSVADIERVRAEAARAHEVLGVERTFYFDLPAPQLDQYPQYKISLLLGELMGQVRPETLYIPHRGDLHRDHGAVYAAALVASRPFANSTVRSIFAYETLSETEWAHPFADDAFIPNHFVDVSQHFVKKLEAMRCFESQLKEAPHSRSLVSIEALATFRGATISVHKAEAFMTVRTIVR